MDSLLKIESLKKYYGKKPNQTKALDGISFQVMPGEFLGIMGSSGSGKSTLLNCIATVIKPDSGTIELQGKEIQALKGAKLAQYRGREIGYLFQNFELLDNLTGRENIMVPLSIHGVSEDESRNRLEKLSSYLEIDNVLDKFPSQMSGGQRQRVAIARALALEPEIIIMDEATSALDVSVQKTIIELVTKLQQEKNITIGFICHDIALIQQCAHQIAVMYLGNVVEVLPGAMLSKNAVHPYTKALMDSIFDINMDFSKPIKGIEGEAPSPLELPVGCPFQGRCEKCMEICKKERPAMIQLDEEHSVACHLYKK